MSDTSQSELCAHADEFGPRAQELRAEVRQIGAAEAADDRTATAPPVAFAIGRLLWLAVGTFAIGTEGFMIAPMLPRIASDLSVTVSVAGQLISVFAFVYAVSSPFSTALTSHLNRKRLLMAAMTAFCAANLLAASSSSYWQLMGARVLLAVASGLYTPNAAALAAAVVSPAHRGRALAVVTGGLTVAIAFGVPAGAVVGANFGWRMTFFGVAVLAALAVIGLNYGISARAGAELPRTTLLQRLEAMQVPGVPMAFLITVIWAAGTYTVYSFIAPYFSAATGIGGAGIGAVLFLWGASAAAGLAVAGIMNDRAGSQVVIRTALAALAIALGSLSIFARVLSPQRALIPVLLAVVLWGAAGWGFYPGQQARLVAITGVRHVSVVLSLNAAFMYLGFSVGATLGALIVAHGSAQYLGAVGAACEVSALSLFTWVMRRSGRDG
jgi:predicted MFS family arabinose efflux permease